jgi:D-3-phosphoglycerate dehydrogenase
MTAAESTVVVVLPMVHPVGEEILRASCARVVSVSADAEAITAAMPDADAVIARGPAKVTASMLEQGSRLRVLSASGAGYDCIDDQAASRLGLPLLYAPGVGAPAVAEWTLGALVVAGRRMPLVDAAVRRDDFAWSGRTGELSGFELRGKTLGVIGLGNIGRRVARLAAAAFEMDVVGYDPFVASGGAEVEAVKLVDSVEELLQAADFLTIHIPLTPDTASLLDAEKLALMKQGACLVNPSRGGIVDETALADALRTGHIRFAVVDVFESEPRIWESPLASAPNCMLSAHVAGLTDLALEDLSRYVAEGVVAALDGNFDPGRIVNPTVLAGVRS